MRRQALRYIKSGGKRECKLVLTNIRVYSFSYMSSNGYFNASLDCKLLFSFITFYSFLNENLAKSMFHQLCNKMASQVTYC